jgi:hypothetical protein
MGDIDVLRELHDAYAWEVNAAVGEDRMDLVWRLAAEYTDRALQLMTAAESPECGRAGCVICARSTGQVRSRRRDRLGRWRSRQRHRSPRQRRTRPS